MHVCAVGKMFGALRLLSRQVLCLSSKANIAIQTLENNRLFSISSRIIDHDTRATTTTKLINHDESNERNNYLQHWLKELSKDEEKIEDNKC